MLNRRRYDLNGKVALITGAARGIGFETARELRTRGARVVITDLEGESVAAAAEQLGGNESETVLGLTADASDRAAMDKVVEAAVEHFGALDICIPNAGIAPPTASVSDIDREVFERVVEVNLLGVWRTVRSAMPQVIATRGQFMLIASAYSFFNGTFASPYACSKAGVEQLGRALRVELAGHGVHTGVVYFGFIDTEMVRATFDRDPRGADFAARIPFPLNRRITAAETAVLLVDGLERRKARVIAPRPWVPLFYLRGITGPLTDAILARDPRIKSLAQKYEGSQHG